jgi:hypothetical protein
MRPSRRPKRGGSEGPKKTSLTKSRQREAIETTARPLAARTTSPTIPASLKEKSPPRKRGMMPVTRGEDKMRASPTPDTKRETKRMIGILRGITVSTGTIGIKETRLSTRIGRAIGQDPEKDTAPVEKSQSELIAGASRKRSQLLSILSLGSNCVI